MKVLSHWLFIMILLIVSGATGWFLRGLIPAWMASISTKKSEPPEIEVDELFLQDYADTLQPSLKALDEIIADTAVQFKWLKNNLKKCIETLEAQHGITSVKTQPNNRFLFPSWPQLVGGSPLVPDISTRRTTDEPNVASEKLLLERKIKKTICQMNLRVISLALLKYSNESEMTGFEKRLSNIFDVNDINHIKPDARVDFSGR